MFIKVYIVLYLSTSRKSGRRFIFGFRIRSQHEAAKWIFYLVHFKYYVEISSPQADVDKPVPKLRWQRKVKAV